MRRLPLPSAALALTLVAGLGASGCTNAATTEGGDTPSEAGAPSALGHANTIAELNNPDAANRPVNNQLNVAVSGATFLLKDTYSETGTASSVGAVYAEDFHSADAGPQPYSGMLLYKPSFEPPSLVLAPGDVVDFIGEYQLYNGPASFSFGGAVEPEMYQPITTFRFDYGPPTPTVINVHDLDSYATGYQWMSMLVTVENTIGGETGGDTSGRGWVFITSDTGQGGIAIDNELYPLNYMDPKYATAGSVHFKSITGIVTYFSTFKIAPRSDADIVLE
jgi:hypothetical protein